MLYSSTISVGSSVLCAIFTSNACFACDEPSKRVGGIGLSQKPSNLRSSRCTQMRAAAVTAGVAVVGEMTSVTIATAVVIYTPLVGGGWSAPCWLVASSNISNSEANVGAVEWCCCVIPGKCVYVLLLDERYDDELKIGMNVFDWFFRLAYQVEKVKFLRKLSRKVLSRISLFFDCARKFDLGFSRERPFSTDKSGCVRNCLTYGTLMNAEL